MTDSPPAAPAPGDGMQTVQMSIEKIYVKDLSLENPGAPQSFALRESPQVEVGLRTRAEQVEPDVYECVLTITVTARVADKTAFMLNGDLVEFGPTDKMFTNPDKKETEDYVTGKFG